MFVILLGFVICFSGIILRVCFNICLLVVSVEVNLVLVSFGNNVLIWIFSFLYFLVNDLVMLIIVVLVIE